MTKEVPHIWETRDEDGESARHLCQSEEGAIQAHLLHYGLVPCDQEITAKDIGKIGPTTERDGICFDPTCVLYGLSFEG